MIAHRIEWLTENDKIIANADPIETPAVAAFLLRSFGLLDCDPGSSLQGPLEMRETSLDGAFTRRSPIVVEGKSARPSDPITSTTPGAPYQRQFPLIACRLASQRCEPDAFQSSARRKSAASSHHALLQHSRDYRPRHEFRWRNCEPKKAPIQTNLFVVSSALCLN